METYLSVFVFKIFYFLHHDILQQERKTFRIVVAQVTWEILKLSHATKQIKHRLSA